MEFKRFMSHHHSLTLMILIFLLIGCNSSNNSAYIISKEDSLTKVKYTTEDGVVIMPPKVFQGDYNFILDSNDNCYFYSFGENISEHYGVFDDELPSPEEWLKQLTPDSLLIVPKGKEVEFFKKNVFNKAHKKSGYSIQIASEKDTITNNFVSYLLRTKSRETNNNMFLNLRHILKVEKTILNKKLAKRATVEN